MAQKHTINDIEKPMTTYGPEQGPNKRYRRLRHPTFDADVWTAKNPLLQKGEIGAEKDTHKIKVGDGVTYWNDLPYVTSVGQPLSTADYQMGNSSGGWTTMSQAQQDALNSGATTTNISAIEGKVNIDGSSTMTGVLKMRASISFECAIAPYWHGVGLYQLNDNDSVTLLASMETPDGWCPGTNDTFNMGSTSKKWKNLYLSGTAYVGAINNGFNIAVPVTNSADEFALKSQVDLKANSADLGTAAYTASTDYATAAQGALADTAVQPGELATVATTGDYDDLLNKPTTLAGYGITDGANTDLSNITSTGQNIGNWSSNVTNCITNIPQDIIAEFDVSTKTLTIKAGSKLYIPNGFEADGTTPHFDTITFATDQTLTNSFTGAYNNILVCWDSANNMFRQSPTHDSGSTDHNTTVGNRFWYDTDTNKIKYYAANNTTVTSDSVSLPVCRMESIGSGNGFKRILNVFNGFGYIGCSTFVLPGVKGLAPNGRNSDGTLKSINVNVTSVHTTTQTFNAGYYYVGFASSAGELGFYGVLITKYDEARNFVVDTYANVDRTWTTAGALIYSDTNHKITSFEKSEAFHAVDYSDKHAITDLLMPDYTAGIEVQNAIATSGSYTAPSNGQFVLDILAGTNTTTFKINNIAVAQQKATTGGAYNATYNVFVKYGDSITWTSSGSGTMKAYFYPMTRI